MAKGLAVKSDVHAPYGAEAESERANWHAHLLITTRRTEGDALSATRARDLDPEVRSAGGRARVADGAAWGELWRKHQDHYFREQGLNARVDATATHAEAHIGPVRMRRTGSDIVERAETIRQANQEAARDQAQKQCRPGAAARSGDRGCGRTLHGTPGAGGGACGIRRRRDAGRSPIRGRVRPEHTDG